MSTWAVSMVKDEDDVICNTLLHMAHEVDGIIVADNLSTDTTREMIEAAKSRAPVPIVVVDDNEPGYYQSAKMTNLARMAHDAYGATWIVPFDADEIWYSRKERISVALASLPEGVVVAPAKLWNHFATALDRDGETVFERMIWRQREPGALPKVAFRWRDDVTILQGNHDVHFGHIINGGATTSFLPGCMVAPAVLELRHFPYRSFAQFMTKARNGAAAYRATDLPEDQGAHWRQYGEILERYGEKGLEEVWNQWFYFPAPVNGGLVKDPAPFMRWAR